MWNIVESEWIKIRRCQILLVGFVALGLCPAVQYASQLVMDPAYREPNYDFAILSDNVVWGNTQIFLPISLVMIGGWMMDRERKDDTMKNIAAVPVSLPAFLGGKLLVTAALAVFFGFYSILATVLTAYAADLPGITIEHIVTGGGRILAAGFNTYIVCMPLILIFGQIPGAYLGGGILSFFLGYSMLFLKKGVLMSLYPFSAALILAGFNMEEYNGALSQPDPFLSAAGLGMTAGLTALILKLSPFSCFLTKTGRPKSKRYLRRPRR